MLESDRKIIITKVRLMFGIIVIGHAQFSNELVKATEHILGPQEKLTAVSMLPDDEAETKRQELQILINALRGDGGVVILTDMFGGTPSNLAISFLEANNIEVIAGVNLPMLIKLLSVRPHHSLVNAVKLAVDAGREYIVMATSLLASDHHRKVTSK